MSDQFIEVTIKAKVKHGKIKAFISHIEQEMQVAQNECAEISSAEVDYTHWV